MIIILLLVNIFLLRKLFKLRKYLLKLESYDRDLTRLIKSYKLSLNHLQRDTKKLKGEKELYEVQLSQLRKLRDFTKLRTEESYIYLAKICIAWNYNLIRIPKLVDCLGDMKEDVFFKEVNHCVI